MAKNKNGDTINVIEKEVAYIAAQGWHADGRYGGEESNVWFYGAALGGADVTLTVDEAKRFVKIIKAAIKVAEGDK